MTDESFEPLNNILDIMNKDSVFTKKSVKKMYAEVQEVYLGDDKPWVIGYSGGKDSTAALQLIWNAVEALPADKRSKKIYVISSNTLVETPAVVNHVKQSLRKISSKTEEENLPFEAHLIEPELNQTFWVNLLGRGYPAPSKEFRWCTDRMKIKPANHFIKEKISENGSVIVVLGVRKSESMTRAQVIKHQKSKIPGKVFSAHSTIPGALVYAPIEDWSVDDVWFYLLQYDSPWGANNRNLSALYQQAAGECPVVIDASTPSCGNSRFGCWTCTVVSRDVALESMIEQGERWMEPMLDIRDMLKDTQIKENKIRTREHKRRDGKITRKNLKAEDGSGKRTVDESSLVFGPYTLDFRKKLLSRLLEARVEVRNKGPEKFLDLVTLDELQEIRRIWLFEERDWEDSLPKIYQKVTGEIFPITKEDVGKYTRKDLELLSNICEEQGVSLEMMMRLLDVERSSYSMINRPKIHQKITQILKMDFQSREETFRAVYGMSEKELLAKLEEES